MKKVLLITYYWPPAGGAGVQRWLKMSKYLSEYGWEPIIYTAEPTQYVSEDQSLMSDVKADLQVLKTPIREPYDIYHKLIGGSKKKSNQGGFLAKKDASLIQKFGLFVRSNFFIPDARMWWVKPSIKYLNKWLSTNQVDAIISTGPPHSMHLIASGIKEKYPNLPWVADFRDPWTNIDFYKDLTLMKFADSKHHRQEHQVMTKADRVVAVTWDMAREFKGIVDRKIDVILNGYDPDDFIDFKSSGQDKFIICHLGSMNKDRNPEALWRAISKLIQENNSLKKQLEIHLVGVVDSSVNKSIEASGLTQYTKFLSFIPHDEAIDYLKKCALLLLTINNTPNSKGILPTKLFEYLASRKPVLAVGPSESDISRVLDEMDHCALCGYDDQNKMGQFIAKVYQDPPTASTQIEKYSRKAHAASFANLLNELV